jgi:hypothetical protein
LLFLISPEPKENFPYRQEKGLLHRTKIDGTSLENIAVLERRQDNGRWI